MEKYKKTTAKAELTDISNLIENTKETLFPDLPTARRWLLSGLIWWADHRGSKSFPASSRSRDSYAIYYIIEYVELDLGVSYHALPVA